MEKFLVGWWKCLAVSLVVSGLQGVLRLHKCLR